MQQSISPERTLPILSAGTQARLQLKALALVRPIREARIWARNATKARTAAQQLSGQLGFSVTAYADPKQAVVGSHVSHDAADQPTDS